MVTGTDATGVVHTLCPAFRGLPLTEGESTAPGIGADHRHRWRRVAADGLCPNDPSEIRVLPAVECLRQIWGQNYLPPADGVTWRENDNIPPAACFISSPYDPEAHYAQKHTTQWIGYKVHFTKPAMTKPLRSSCMWKPHQPLSMTAKAAVSHSRVSAQTKYSVRPRRDKSKATASYNASEVRNRRRL